MVQDCVTCRLEDRDNLSQRMGMHHQDHWPDLVLRLRQSLGPLLLQGHVQLEGPAQVLSDDYRRRIYRRNPHGTPALRFHRRPLE